MAGTFLPHGLKRQNRTDARAAVSMSPGERIVVRSSAYQLYAGDV